MTRFKHLVVRSGLLIASMLVGVAAATTPTSPTVGHNSTYLRAAYQIGSVLASNDFVKGNNATGEPIDSYHSARLEFGWQTDGALDWHHVYNFPSFGLGVNIADYFNEEELGKPTSIYGFFNWPVKRWGRNSLNFDLGFGLADNWVGFDPVTNPYNVAIGAGRSVFIDVGLNYEFPLSRRWWLLAGFTGSHYSNGGSQQPNFGINQVGGLLYVKYDLQERRLPATRRQVAPYKPRWELSTTFALGQRNLSLDLRDTEYEVWLDKDYLIGNFVVTMARQFSHMSRYDFGLDLEYDESVSDIVLLESLKQGTNLDPVDFWDKLGLGVFGGYEHVVARANLIVQLGYVVFRRDVPDVNGNEARLPRFYQRLGLKYHVLDDLFLGVNVRFHDFSRADNLEFNLGWRWWL